MSDARRMAERYARRDGLDHRYSPLRPDVWHTLQERQRALLRLLGRLGWDDLRERRVVEIGCGAGGNLLEMLRLGCMPEHLIGIELLPQRLAQARRVLPDGLRLLGGDACDIEDTALAPASQDMVLLSTVLSSVLEDAGRRALADAAWRWLRPGGGVLCYDFTIDNPRNPDVRGVPRTALRRLFPKARISAQRVTLAPPLARALCRIHPSLYPLANALPLLRTHLLAWIEKP